ncbi:MAG: hypothetical protein GY719_03885, partial [bacterium]|nr:hypothetical protein [bacterium]
RQRATAAFDRSLKATAHRLEAVLDAGGLFSLADAVRPWTGRRGRPPKEKPVDLYPDLVARAMADLPVWEAAPATPKVAVSTLAGRGPDTGREALGAADGRGIADRSPRAGATARRYADRALSAPPTNDRTPIGRHFPAPEVLRFALPVPGKIGHRPRGSVAGGGENRNTRARAGNGRQKNRTTPARVAARR